MCLYPEELQNCRFPVFKSWDGGHHSNFLRLECYSSEAISGIERNDELLVLTLMYTKCFLFVKLCYIVQFVDILIYQ